MRDDDSSSLPGGQSAPHPMFGQLSSPVLGILSWLAALCPVAHSSQTRLVSPPARNTVLYWDSLQVLKYAFRSAIFSQILLVRP